MSVLLTNFKMLWLVGAYSFNLFYISYFDQDLDLIRKELNCAYELIIKTNSDQLTPLAILQIQFILPVFIFLY